MEGGKLNGKDREILYTKTFDHKSPPSITEMNKYRLIEKGERERQKKDR